MDISFLHIHYLWRLVGVISWTSNNHSTNLLLLQVLQGE
jgi:hypothetical protein